MILVERYNEDNPVKRLFNHEDSDRNIERAIEMVRNSSIIEECFAVASGYCARACHSLSELNDNHTHRVLIELADYIAKRQK
jgi:geranylgeranyl pyrophosphate synthase